MFWAQKQIEEDEHLFSILDDIYYYRKVVPISINVYMNNAKRINSEQMMNK